MSKRTPSTGLGSLGAGAVTAAALAVQTGLAAVVGVIIARRFGRDAETDGFFAAYAVFVVLALAATSARVVVLPSLARARSSGRLASETARFAACIVLLAVPALVLAVAIPGQIAAVITGFGPESARAQAVDALPWLVFAAVGQFGAGLASSALAALDDYRTSAIGYALGSTLGLALILWRIDADGIDCIAWGMGLNALVAAFVPTIALIRRARGAGVGRSNLDPPGAFRLGERFSMLARGIALPFALQGVYLVCLALASREGIGAATTLGYAFLIGSALVAVTAGSLGLATAVPVTAVGIDASGVARHVDAASWIAFVGIAGTAGLSAVAGGPAIGHLLGASYSGDVGDELGRVVGALAPWMVVTTGVSVAYPLLFVMGRLTRLPRYALAVVVLHLPLAVVGGWLGGLYGLAVALALSTGVGLALMLRELGAASIVLRDLLRAAIVVGGISALAFVPAGLLLPPAAAGGLGLLLYLLALVTLRPAGIMRSWRYLRALG